MSSILLQVFLVSSLLYMTISYCSNMGTCKMVCENPNGVSSWGVNSTRSRPGKRGPSGLKGEKGVNGITGPKGDAADPCICPEHTHLQKQIDDLRNQLKRVYAPTDCREVLVRGENNKGNVYHIYPSTMDSKQLEVYCDTSTDSGGWIVFQRRMDGSEDFFRNWADYVKGFGDLNGEFWLGLDKIHRLMNEGQYELRVDMADFENNTAFAKYSYFYVEGPATFYALTASGYTGNAGNHIEMTNVSFSTKDQDHDTCPAHCAQSYKGGWWYTQCHGANPNGLYLGGVHESYANGVIWRHFKGYHYSLKFLEMKMRKKNI